MPVHSEYLCEGRKMSGRARTRSTENADLRARLAWAGLGTGTAAVAVYSVIPLESLGSRIGFLLAAAVGVAMSWVGVAFQQGRRRRIWLAVAAGQTMLLLGDVLWFVYENLLHISPYPSVADAVYLSRYPLVALGLMWLIRGRRRGRDRAALLDAAIISTGFMALGAEFVVIPATAGGGESLLSQSVAGSYPVADLLMFAVLVRLFTGGATRALSFWALAGGTAVMLAADTLYTLSVVHGAPMSSLMKIGWLASYLLIGFAMLHPSVDHLSEPSPDRPERFTVIRVGLLGAALALAPVTEAVRDARGHEGFSAVVTVGALAGISLVLMRMWGLLRDLQVQAVQLAELARNDSLTGIANRRTWDHDLARACDAARERNRPLAVAIADLDHFKLFNDVHGHVMGDMVLKQTTAAWAALLDGRGVLARFGGEEFTVLLPNTSAQEAGALLDRLRGAVSHEQTCSIGIAAWNGHEHPDALISRADQALYHAKRTGRDRLALHDGRGARTWTRQAGGEQDSADGGVGPAHPKSVQAAGRLAAVAAGGNPG